MPTRITDERGRTDVRLLLALFDRLPAMIAYWDSDARNVLANAAYLEWFGFDPARMRGVHISEVLGPAVYEKNLPYIRAALAGEEQLFDRTLVDQAGQVRHTQASYVPDVVDGVVRGFFVLVTDVTPRVEAQRRADEAQSLASLGSWELDVAHGTVEWSRTTYSIIGEPDPGEPLSLATLSDRIHPEDRERVLDNIATASVVGRSYKIGYRIVRPDGAVREVFSIGHPSLGPDGEVVRIAGTLQDVTEANEAARELSRINAALLEANRLNADLIGILSHDTRNSLTATRGCLDMLEKSWEAMPAPAQDLVRLARRSTDRLNDLVGSVSAMAAVETGEVRVTPEIIDVDRTLDELARELGLPGDGWSIAPPGSRATCRCDPVHFSQIVGNLLSNAVRYGAMPVTVHVEEHDDALELSVGDGGDGVPGEVVPTLFSRYARTGPRQARAGGTGFGLYVSARLAAANGGALSYRQAEEHRPHAFVLRLPR